MEVAAQAPTTPIEAEWARTNTLVAHFRLLIADLRRRDRPGRNTQETSPAVLASGARLAFVRNFRREYDRAVAGLRTRQSQLRVTTTTSPESYKGVLLDDNGALDQLERLCDRLHKHACRAQAVQRRVVEMEEEKRREEESQREFALHGRPRWRWLRCCCASCRQCWQWLQSDSPLLHEKEQDHALHLEEVALLTAARGGGRQ